MTANPTIPPHILAALPADLSTAPTVAPREGAMGMMRNGEAVGPFDGPFWHQSRPAQLSWQAPFGSWMETGRFCAPFLSPELDLIAVWHPAPAQEAAPMRCAECWCEKGGEHCEWIASTPPTDPLDAVRAAIRALRDEDLERMVGNIVHWWTTVDLMDALRDWAKGEKE